MAFLLIALLASYGGLAYTAPQGYNYQVVGTNNLSLEQLQLLQQYAQDQPPTAGQQESLTQAPAGKREAQGSAAEQINIGGGYKFTNQVQQGQQVGQYEQQQGKDSRQEIQQPTFVITKPAPKNVEIVHPITQQLQSFGSTTGEELQHPQQLTHYPVPQLPAKPQSQTQPIAQPKATVQHYSQPSVQYNKEFFYLSAPQEDYEAPQQLQDELTSLRKNLRVVFIKAPEHNGLSDAAVQLAKHTAQQQTAVYVLTKQYDANELAQKLQQSRVGVSAPKPEVVFIKYRTPAEAEEAQRTIQAQYEALEGPNHFNHEGVAPTHNFVSGASIDPRAKVKSPVSAYLPAAAKLK